PAAEGAALLALDLLPGTPEAEAIVKRQLAARAGNPMVRVLYVPTAAAAPRASRGVGSLTATAGAVSARLGGATPEIEVLTRSDPNLAPPWLTLGALQLEMKRPREASDSLRNYVRLVEGGAAVNFGAAASSPHGASGDDEDDTPPN